MAPSVGSGSGAPRASPWHHHTPHAVGRHPAHPHELARPTGPTAKAVARWRGQRPVGSSAGYVVLIDGYNVVKQHPAWRDASLLEGRQRLITALPTVPWPVPVARMHLVFDGPEDSTSQPSERVRVTFASPTADAEIREIIQTSARPDRLLVISNDQEILHTAKTHGALRYRTQWLIERTQTGLRTPPGRGATQGHGLTGSQMRRINDELSKRWRLDPPPA